MRAHTVCRHVLRRVHGKTERVAIERQRLLRVAHGDPDVIQNGPHDD